MFESFIGSISEFSGVEKYVIIYGIAIAIGLLSGVAGIRLVNSLMGPYLKRLRLIRLGAIGVVVWLIYIVAASYFSGATNPISYAVMLLVFVVYAGLLGLTYTMWQAAIHNLRVSFVFAAGIVFFATLMFFVLVYGQQFFIPYAVVDASRNDWPTDAIPFFTVKTYSAFEALSFTLHQMLAGGIGDVIDVYQINLSSLRMNPSNIEFPLYVLAFRTTVAGAFIAMLLKPIAAQAAKTAKKKL